MLGATSAKTQESENSELDLFCLVKKLASLEIRRKHKSLPGTLSRNYFEADSGEEKPLVLPLLGGL
jgi:hypothetical protein